MSCLLWKRYQCYGLPYIAVLQTRDVVLVSTSRSRDVPTSRLGLVSTKMPNLVDLCVSDLVSVSTQNVSCLVEGLGPFRLVEMFHAGAPNLTIILQ